MQTQTLISFLPGRVADHAELVLLTVG